MHQERKQVLQAIRPHFKFPPLTNLFAVREFKQASLISFQQPKKGSAFNYAALLTRAELIKN